MNLGSRAPVTLLELAETVIGVTGSHSDIAYEALPVDDPLVRLPDITRARELLGWEPEISLEDGLRRLAASAGVATMRPAAPVRRSHAPGNRSIRPIGLSRPTSPRN